MSSKQKIKRTVLIVLVLIVWSWAGRQPFGVLTVWAKDSSTLFEQFPVPDNQTLWQNLDFSNPQLAALRQLPVQQALKQLASYFKKQAAQRYYFNWQHFKDRLAEYLAQFPEKKAEHLRLAAEHMATYRATTAWQLPLTSPQGQAITSYQFRHLARQSKMPDVVLSYFLSGEDSTYLKYFLNQVRSLNIAFAKQKVETGGNAVFEKFRAAKRIHHWLFAHHAFLAAPAYTPEDQLLMLRTFLHHAQILAYVTRKNSVGNHHTRGLVALFEIAALFPEFRQSQQWRAQALKGLIWHMENEINDDGFQFERSGHYHKGDIENYLRVYQLARLNHLSLPAIFQEKFRALFEVLVKLAMPDGFMPVLQDDTDGGSPIEADISEPLAVGSMLFGDPVFRYFAGQNWPVSFYWLLTTEQLNAFYALPAQQPQIGSVALKSTGYYVMRDGWQKDSRYLLISAGLEKRKPDHQHGDMLGLVAYAGGSVFLPNYKVRYNRADFPFLKNSWAKNVALVDSQPQGRRWQANRGKSGFGKWRYLPEPQVQCWETSPQLDYFYGSHNGFSNRKVSYSREVLFVKQGFWIVRDVFQAKGTHTYQQVWQGPFEKVNNRHLHQPLANGQWVHLVQLTDAPFRVLQSSFGKYFNSVFEVRAKGDFTFTTLIIPQEIQNKDKITFENFTIEQKGKLNLARNLSFVLEAVVKRANNIWMLIGVKKLNYNQQVVTFAQPVHVLVLNKTNQSVTMQVFGTALNNLSTVLKSGNSAVLCASKIELPVK